MSRARYTAIWICCLTGCLETTEVSESSTSSSCDRRLAPGQVANANGVAETYSLLGPLDEVEETNAFFANLGTSGRTCASCHAAKGGWTPSASQELWDRTRGEDPLFMFTHDVGLCPDVDITKRRDRKHEMKLLLERGLTRSTATVADTAEFEVVAVEDPYGCARPSPSTFYGYRKPNPSFAASHKTSVTWAPAPQPDLRATLRAIMVGGTRVHGLTTYTASDEEQDEAADFMTFTYFAQIEDDEAGRLDADGARGGPVHLASQEWFVGINDASVGPTTRKVFDIYDAWIGSHNRRRALIAEGQELFNFRQNASGRTCSGCHNSPNVGTHSTYRLFDIGIVDVADRDLPRIHLRNKTTGEERVVSNLGRAAATGLWSDIGRMAVPILRGLSSRAPYFSSGQARRLRDVVDHYDRRFDFKLTRHERAALVAFLEAL